MNGTTLDTAKKPGKLDSDSKRFMKSVMDTVYDDEALAALVEDIIDDFREFVLMTYRLELMEQLENKMIAGAKEHGPPKKIKNEIVNEIQQEYLDLLVWTIMKYR